MGKPTREELLSLLRYISDELRRTVDENGRIIHMNRSNDIYVTLKRAWGEDYWERFPDTSRDAPKIVLRHISGD